MGPVVNGSPRGEAVTPAKILLFYSFEWLSQNRQLQKSCFSAFRLCSVLSIRPGAFGLVLPCSKAVPDEEAQQNGQCGRKIVKDTLEIQGRYGRAPTYNLNQI
jgi:hypothetical protein